MGSQMQIYLEFLFLFVKYRNILRSTKYFALAKLHVLCFFESKNIINYSLEMSVS